MTAPIALLSPQQRLLLKELARGQLVSTHHLADVLYGARWDGGPDDPVHVVHNQVSRMRPILDAYGISLLTIGRARGSRGYRVDPDDVTRLARLLDRMAAMDIEMARARRRERALHLVGDTLG